jgi:hypothetical protein
MIGAGGWKCDGLVIDSHSGEFGRGENWPTYWTSRRWKTRDGDGAIAGPVLQVAIHEGGFDLQVPAGDGSVIVPDFSSLITQELIEFRVGL